MLIEAYRPGTSWVHRRSAATKLSAVLVLSAALAIWPSWWSAAIGAGLVAAAFGVARIGWQTISPAVRMLWLWVVLLSVMTWWAQGLMAAIVSVATMVVVVMAATLMAATTPTQALMDVIIRLCTPLRHVGIRPQSVGLAFGLVLRTVPVLGRIISGVREAQQARGCSRSLRTFVTPVAVRTVRYADQVGQALAARGFDDD